MAAVPRGEPPQEPAPAPNLRRRGSGRGPTTARSPETPLAYSVYAWCFLQWFVVANRAPRECVREPNTSDDTLFLQPVGIARTHAEPVAEDLGGVLAQQRRRFDWWGSAVKAHREGRHAQLSAWMPHGLDEAALGKARLGEEIAGVEDRTRRHAGDADQPHRFVFVVPPRPVAQQRIDLRFVLGARGHGRKAWIIDQIGPPDNLEQSPPMLRVVVAGEQENIVVGPTRLARIDAVRRQPTRHRLGAVAHCGLAAARMLHKSAARVLQLRVLHCDLHAPA